MPVCVNDLEKVVIRDKDTALDCPNPSRHVAARYGSTMRFTGEAEASSR